MKRVVCCVWLAFQASNLCAADQYEYCRLFLQFQKVTGLPLEILNHIAIFLTFDDRETDEEFVARIKRSDLLPGHTLLVESYKELADIKGSYTIDRKGIVLCGKWSNPGSYGYDSVEVHLMGIENNSIEKFDQLKKYLKDYAYYYTVDTALSRTQQQFAYLGFIDFSGFDESFLTYCLMYINMLKDTQKHFEVSEKFSDESSKRIFFNKQGTKLFVHEVNKAGDDKYHTFNVASEEEHKELSRKSMNAYFAQLYSKQ